MKVSQSEKKQWSYVILGYIFNVENLAKICLCEYIAGFLPRPWKEAMQVRGP